MNWPDRPTLSSTIAPFWCDESHMIISQEDLQHFQLHLTKKISSFLFPFIFQNFHTQSEKVPLHFKISKQNIKTICHRSVTCNAIISMSTESRFWVLIHDQSDHNANPMVFIIVIKGAWALRTHFADKLSKMDSYFFWLHV